MKSHQPSTSFDAVFFDFGGVVLESPFQRFEEYEISSGLPVGVIRSINQRNADRNAWAEFERGAISIEEFELRFEREAEEFGFRVSARDVLACLDVAPRPAMVAFVERCHRCFKTALLTNNVVSTRTVDLRFAEILDHFDHIVESSVVGVRKPDSAFYRLACDLAEVHPARVLFLDDLGINLKPARELGMRTIKVVDPNEAIVEAEAMLFVPG